MSDVIDSFGPFKVLTANHGSNDYVLTDENESVLLGFKEEEAADIEILMERLQSGE